MVSGPVGVLNKKEPTWFEQVSPGLLRNKAIRNYLSNYAAKDYAEVIKLTVLYGLVTLHRQYPGQLLSLEQLREVLATGQVAVAVEEALPGVHAQLDKLQLQLDELVEDLHEPLAHNSNVLAAAPVKQQSPHGQHEPVISVLSVPSAPGQAPIAAQLAPAARGPVAARAHVAAVQQAMDGAARRRPPEAIPAAARVRRNSSPITAPMPSSEWRSGDDARTWSPPGRKRSPVRREEAPAAAVYPAWWGDGSEKNEAKAKPAMDGQQQQARAPPRLAYSMMPAVPPIFQDDLVTARYLQVPSSGYGQQQGPVQVDGAMGGAYAGQPPPPPNQGMHPFQLAGAAPPMNPFLAPPMQPAQQYPGMQQQLPAPFMQGQQPMYMMHPSGVAVPVVFPAGGVQVPAQQQQGGSEGEAGGKGKRGKAVNPRNVESRIKQQVQADKAAARQRVEARNRAVQSALRGAAQSPRGAPRPTTPSSAAGAPLPAASSTRSPATPSDIADSIASSPWASWFMAEDDAAAADESGVVSAPPAAAAAAQAQAPPQQVAGAYPYPAVAPAPVPAYSVASNASRQQQQQLPAPMQGSWPSLPMMPPQGGSYAYGPYGTGPAMGMGQPMAPFNASSEPSPMSLFGQVMVSAPMPQQGIQPAVSQAGVVLPGGGLQQQGSVAWEVGSAASGAAGRAADPFGLRAQGVSSPGTSQPRQAVNIRTEVKRFAKSWVGDYGHLTKNPAGSSGLSSAPSTGDVAAGLATADAHATQKEALRAQLAQRGLLVVDPFELQPSTAAAFAALPLTPTVAWPSQAQLPQPSAAVAPVAASTQQQVMPQVATGATALNSTLPSSRAYTEFAASSSSSSGGASSITSSSSASTVATEDVVHKALGKISTMISDSDASELPFMLAAATAEAEAAEAERAAAGILVDAGVEEPAPPAPAAPETAMERAFAPLARQLHGLAHGEATASGMPSLMPAVSPEGVWNWDEIMARGTGA